MSACHVRRRFHWSQRAMRTLLVFTFLAPLLGALMPRSASADQQGYNNERVIFQNYAWEVYVSGDNTKQIPDGRVAGSIVICKKALTNDACINGQPSPLDGQLYGENLGGQTSYHPVIAASGDGSFLTVMVRGGTNSLYYKTTKADLTAAAVTCAPNEVAVAGFSCWGATPTNVQVGDNPVGYGVSNTVVVDYLDPNDHYKHAVYSPDGGVTFYDPNYALGLGIPYGTNVLNRTNGSDWAALQRLAPTVMRVRMYLKPGDTPRFTLGDLDTLYSYGTRTFLINGSDIGYDWANVKREITQTISGGTATGKPTSSTIIDLGRRWPDAAVIFEVGNEPDRAFIATAAYTGAADKRAASDADAASKRDAMLDTFYNYYYRGEVAGEPHAVRNPNFRLMVSLPTRNPDGRGTDPTQAEAEAKSYFDTFTGLGNVPTNSGMTGYVGNDGSFVAVHTYANGDCLSDSGHSGEGIAGENPFAIVTLALQRSNRPLFITETGINATKQTLFDDPTTTIDESAAKTQGDRWNELGLRYVDGMAWFDFPEGRVRGITFYETAFGRTNADKVYSIDADESTAAPVAYAPTGDYPAHTRVHNRDRALPSGCYSATGRTNP